MSIKKEKTNNKNEIKITFTVEAERFEGAIQHVFKENAKYFTVPGFRKGKAPFNIVAKQYGVEMFYEDAFNHLLPEVYDEEIEKNKLEVVSKPEIKVLQMEKGKELIFEAVVSTRPDVELGNYKGIELKKIEYKVKAEDVKHELEHMAEHNSRMVSVEDRAVKKDDIANIDYLGTVNGVEFAGGKAEKYDLTIGSNTFIPGFEDQVIGMKIGEERDIKVTFPKEYHAEEMAGKDANFHVKLNSIKVKEMPAIDDEFAKDVSEFDTLEELKEDIKKRLTEENNHKAEHEMEDKAIETVIESSKVDIPAGMIEVEIDSMEENIDQRLQYQGLNLEQYMKILGKTKKELRDEFKEEAEKNVKYKLVIDAIVKAEKIKADKKFIKEEVENMSKQYGKDVKEIESRKDIMDYLEQASKNKQAVKFIIDNAKISK